LLGALGYYFSKIDIPLAQIATACIVAVWGFWPREVPRTNVLLNKNSAYGQIKVVDFQDQKRYLLVDGTSQSVSVLATGESDSQYCRALEMTALLRPSAKRALVIGLGAGLIPAALERAYGLVVDSVEIDPVIAAAARRFFGYAPKGDVFIRDGRTFVESTDRRYGIIILDAFGAESPPYHLFTRESFAAVKRALKPDGVFALNIVSLIRRPGDEAWLSTYKTLASVFPNVRAFIASDVNMDIGNILIFSSEAAMDLDATARPRRPIEADIAMLKSQELRPDGADLSRAVLMDDDRAPMEFLLAPTAALWRQNLQKTVSNLLLY
jgi:spermidine synthase